MTVARTWWHAHNAELEALTAEDRRWLPEDADLPTHVLDLLDAVEARFAAARTVADWADPHEDPATPGEHAEPREEEYSRVSHPERHVVVGERVQAWVDELVARGLAGREEVPPPRPAGPSEPPRSGDGWLLRPYLALDRVVVLRPHRAGALPLVLGQIGSEAVVVAASSPAVELALLPDCGCDACDSGSAALLQEVDEAVLPVVDGSLRVRVTAEREQVASAGSARTASWARSDTRARRRALGRGAYEHAGPPWDPAWPVRRPSPFA
ncbi:hypothetical protein GCM10009633_23390 [Janibacter melonis]|uniref:DUF6226 family protein n=1 Tax=Janibacter melonis TaxID=262209 RepID=UPI001E5444C5|nr:DUF6226 family protein [Janibacter melonis]MCB5991521.1 DUF6226 family protein [Janibacter melonis]